MKFASELLILLAVGVVVGGIVEDRVACRAHDGQPVDW